MGANDHGTIWAAISTAAGTCALALFRIGQQWGTLLTRMEYMAENQQAIADHLGITLPHPYVKAAKRDDVS